MSHSFAEADISCDLSKNCDVKYGGIVLKDIDVDFGDQLCDLPEVSQYISKLHSIIRRQQKKLQKIKAKLKTHRSPKLVKTCDATTQTDPEEIKQLDDGDGISWSGDIAEGVKKVAEQAMSKTSFVYEPTSGMYYDTESGYYYNAEARMYYDGNTGRYLIYNEETKEYRYDESQQMTIAASSAAAVPEKAVTEPRARKRKRSIGEGVEHEEGELSDSSDEEQPIVDEKVVEQQPLVEKTDTNNGVQNTKDEEQVLADVSRGWPPCLRLMVLSTSVKNLSPGHLFLVTCEGGDVGREKQAAVLLPETAVSKVHLKIAFKETAYFITDVGSRNGTWINEKRLSAALQESEPSELEHGDELKIGSTVLGVHVHIGQETCPTCEPGLLQVKNKPLEPLPASISHRAALKNMKKRFGVGVSPKAPTENPAGAQYTDRAEIRRTEKGSSHPAEKTETACITRSIPSENKGFKMLSKMGWSAGQKLGKNNQGLAEPVPVIGNVGSTGLGAEALPNIIATATSRRKRQVLETTRARYDQPPQLPDDQEDETD